MASNFTLDLDRDEAEWLAVQASELFTKTNDYAWQEIAHNLDRQLEAAARDED